MSLIEKVVHIKGLDKFPKLTPVYSVKNVKKALKYLPEIDGEKISLTIQEKLDGANARIFRPKGEDHLILLSRNTQVGKVFSKDEFEGDFRGFVPYVAKYFDFFMENLPEDVTIFGEWLVRHSLNYPEEMFGKYYLFSLSDDCELPHTRTLGTLELSVNPTSEEIQDLLNQLGNLIKEEEQKLQRPMEGVVLYYGSLPVFKFVPERLQEKSRVKESKEHSLELEEISEVTLQKRLNDVKTRLGIESIDELPQEKTPQLIGIFINMVWEDFVREVLPEAILDKKNKNVKNINLAELKSRLREQSLNYLKQKGLV